jgi:hypothetical protein
LLSTIGVLATRPVGSVLSLTRDDLDATVATSNIRVSGRTAVLVVFGKRSVPRVGLLTVIVFARLSRAGFDVSTIVVTVFTVGVVVYYKF